MCPWHPGCCSRPSIKVASAPPVGVNSATVIVTPPPDSAPGGKSWRKYELRVCPTLPPSACATRDCSEAPKPHPGTSACSLTELARGTKYSVEVGALPTACKHRGAACS